jgi:hypothetical protein
VRARCSDGPSELRGIVAAASRICAKTMLLMLILGSRKLQRWTGLYWHSAYAEVPENQSKRFKILCYRFEQFSVNSLILYHI